MTMFVLHYCRESSCPAVPKDLLKAVLNPMDPAQASVVLIPMDRETLCPAVAMDLLRAVLNPMDPVQASVVLIPMDQA